MNMQLGLILGGQAIALLVIFIVVLVVRQRRHKQRLLNEIEQLLNTLAKEQPARKQWLMHVLTTRHQVNLVQANTLSERFAEAEKNFVHRLVKQQLATISLIDVYNQLQNLLEQTVALIPEPSAAIVPVVENTPLNQLVAEQAATNTLPIMDVPKDSFLEVADNVPPNNAEEEDWALNASDVPEEQNAQEEVMIANVAAVPEAQATITDDTDDWDLAFEETDTTTTTQLAAK